MKSQPKKTYKKLNLKISVQFKLSLFYHQTEQYFWLYSMNQL